MVVGLVLGLHIYALAWLVGLYASIVVRPHQLQPDGLHVRDGIFTELIVPYPAIIRSESQTPCEHGPIAMPASSKTRLSGLDITVDDTNGFLDRLRSVRR